MEGTTTSYSDAVEMAIKQVCQLLCIKPPISSLSLCLGYRCFWMASAARAPPRSCRVCVGCFPVGCLPLLPCARVGLWVWVVEDRGW